MGLGSNRVSFRSENEKQGQCMKTLYLLRHGKSSWETPGQRDFDRPLKNRGIQAARLMGRHMAATSLRPELILCSAAARAQQTLSCFLEGYGEEPECLIEDGLYHSTSKSMIERLSAVPDDIPSVMIVGHNPGMQHLALDLAESASGDWHRMREKFPTAALAVMTLDEPSWSPITPGSFTLQGYFKPKELEAFSP